MQSTERRSYIGTYPSHVARDQRNAAPGGGNTFDGGGSSTLAVVGGRSDGGASAARHLLHLRYFLSPDTVRLFLYRTLEKVIESAGLTVVSVCFFFFASFARTLSRFMQCRFDHLETTLQLS